MQNGTQYHASDHLDIKRKGAAPAFLIGLEDLEFHEGDAAALAGKVAKSESLISSFFFKFMIL